MPPAAPTQMLCLSLTKWPGRMWDTNCMGFSSRSQNSFCFQGTLLLDMGLDALCQSNAGGKCFLALTWVTSSCSSLKGACGRCTWKL